VLEWCGGVLEWWGAGVVGCWSGGVLEWWGAGVVEFLVLMTFDRL
jgi:hypothetical protein